MLAPGGADQQHHGDDGRRSQHQQQQRPEGHVEAGGVGESRVEPSQEVVERFAERPGELALVLGL
ncbi:hypothetical protein [Nesterenkonia sp. NBAIMH1]|uniref:hypothetical protein n=1 Tax=Nesterenkonia sp. NBAIMH1 TaxID=2600320 RepID=UPI0011B5B12E|nr:hypothetical protein [Nesterenkonia sp. NBAIMH1]